MAGVQEEIKAPLTVIDALFAQSAAASGGSGSLLDKWGEKEHFVQALGLADEEAFSQIPCLNEVDLVESLRPFSLVRYRGLVQDVFEPEIYSAVAEERDAPETSSTKPSCLLTTKYRECVEPAPGRVLRDLGHKAYSQRGACYCFPLPAESAWTQTRTCPTAAQPELSLSDPPRSKKRGRDDEDVSMEPDMNRPSKQEVTVPPPPKPYGKATELCSADEFGLNFPLPWEERRGRGSSTACIVKTYDEDQESLRICDAVEIVGVLCVNPEVASFETAPLGDSLCRDARDPSTSMVPRLHAIVVRQLPFHQPMLPFTSTWLTEARLANAFQRTFSAPGALAAARHVAVRTLSCALGGDMLAAEYLLMLLVSRSFDKCGEKSLGSWTLNFTHWPTGSSVAGIREAAANLVPRAVCLEVTTQSLEKHRWKPTKDFVANRLVAAQLQLARGTLLILDETKLAEGQLSASGVQALKAIGTVVTDQMLPCDFSSYDVNIPLELFCVSVSSKGRSIISGMDVALPMSQNPAAESATLPQEAYMAGAMDAVRMLLGLVTRSPRPVKFSEEVAHRFSEDFAAVRQTAKVPAELCHTWMGLARAYCLTHGEQELSAARWSSVLTMEKERLQRCAQVGFLGGA